MVGMASDREGEDDDPGCEVPDFTDDDPTGALVVLQMGIAETGIAAFHHAEDLRGTNRFRRAQVRVAARARFTGREIQDARAISRVPRLEQRAGAGELDVVPMGGDGEKIDGHDTDRDEEVEV
jgi:hypothetical protein